MAATTISVEGDKAFVSQLKKLAALREQKIGHIVRAALDQVYGEELQRLADPSFFASSDAQKHHNS